MVKVLAVLVFVAGCVVLGQAGTDEDMKALMASLHQQCVDDIGANEDLVAKAQAGDFTDDEKLKCYMMCTMNEVGVVNDDGTLDVEGIVAMMPDEKRSKMEPTIRKCGQIAGANACETSFSFYKCCFETAPEDYVLP